MQLSLEGCPACVDQKAELVALAAHTGVAFAEVKLSSGHEGMAFPQVLVIEKGALRQDLVLPTGRRAPGELSALF